MVGKKSKSRLKRKRKKLDFSRLFLWMKKKLFPKKTIWTKFRKKITQFHHKLIRHPVLSNPIFTRVVIICFFLGLNIVLVPYFLRTNSIQIPREILDYLDEKGFIDASKYNFEYIPPQVLKDQEQPSLQPAVILEKLNEERAIRDLPALEYDDRLASAAAELMVEAQKFDYDLKDHSFIEQLKAALEEANYNYSHVSHNMVIGPLLEDAVIDAWLSDEHQLEALFQDEYDEIGLATMFHEFEGDGTYGIVVQVLGTEFAENQQVQDESSQQQEAQETSVNSASIEERSKNFPPISSQEVFDALNSYRQSHGVKKLATNDELCQYAQKRVADLVANNGLDDHAGFMRDFASSATIPEIIRQYSGSRIAENLAYQNCRNMQTGDGFIAETGTAIIEWCFDSSTAGHKEAQLSSEFNHACVASQYGMFVVIFGDG